jgi:hypothetical protein
VTDKAIEESYNIPVMDRLENVDLALEVFEKLGGKLLTRYCLDCDRCAGFL